MIEASVKNYKPKMKSLNDVKWLPFPCVATAKADGEFSVVVWNGEKASSSNVNERVRTQADLIALEELEIAMKEKGVGTVLFLAELHGVKDGTPQRLPYFNSHKDDPDLILGFFDYKFPQSIKRRETYFERLMKMQDWFRGFKHIRVLPFAKVEDMDEAEDFWDEVMLRGYEGVVARDGMENVYKVKPYLEVDCAIIGVNKREKLKDGEVTSIKVAVRDEKGLYIDLSDVASGIDLKLRKELMSLLDFKIFEGKETIFIEPKIVVTVGYNETYEAEKGTMTSMDGRWAVRQDEHYPFFSLRHPRLVRFRTDKTTDIIDIPSTQVE